MENAFCSYGPTAADIHPETIKALLGVHKVAVELAEKSQTEVGYFR